MHEVVTGNTVNISIQKDFPSYKSLQSEVEQRIHYSGHLEMSSTTAYNKLLDVNSDVFLSLHSQIIVVCSK